MANNGYLEKDRLANVIAAIQIMAVADDASGELSRWIGELDAGDTSTEGRRDRAAVSYAVRKKWASVFEDHPEFFKLFTVMGEPQVALRMRLAQGPAQADTAKPADAAEAPETDSAAEKSSDAKPQISARLSKPAIRPLAAEQIGVLIRTAIDLHTLTVGDTHPPERHLGGRWLFSAAGAIVGSIVGGSLVAFMVWSPAAVQIFH